MMGLTPGQAKVLAVIKRWRVEHGRAPSIVEIMAECELRSKSTAFERLEALEAKGRIRRKLRRARAIELIEQPARYHFIPVSDLTWPVAA